MARFRGMCGHDRTKLMRSNVKSLRKIRLSRGSRALLNFGHTLGHAIEKLREFSRCFTVDCVGVGCICSGSNFPKTRLSDGGTGTGYQLTIESYFRWRTRSQVLIRHK